jgi:hypothetical protein
MTRRSRRVFSSIGASAAVLAVSLCVGPGCGGSDEPLEFRLGRGGAGPHGASTAAGSSVSSTAISTGSLGGYFEEEEKDAGDLCQPKPLPPEVPEGWVEYLDWSCTCRMYVPGSKDVMPAPIQWKACPDLPAGIQCKVMVTDWQFGGDTPIAIGAPQFDRNPDGTGVLGIRRITWKGRALYDIVADVDGQVRMAILRVGEPSALPDCYLITQSVNEGKYLYAAYENKYEGAIGGSIDDLKPTALARYKRKEWSKAGWSVGAKWIMKLGDGYVLRALSWDLSKDIFLSSPSVDPDGDAAGHLLVRGDAIFWSSSSLYHHRFNVWTASGGARTLLGWAGERTKGAAAFNTDGVDMVWAYGEGKRPGGKRYPRRSIMTAPFTTHPEKIQPRRLRSHPYDTVSNERFVVGCGYAAHPRLADGGVGVMVVRLSDGVAWTIPYTPDFKHPTPIGVTCDEVFLRGYFGGLWNIARVRIDSLGPGLPPD